MVVLVNKIYRTFHSLDAKQLMSLKGNAMYEQWIIALLIAPLAISLASLLVSDKSADNLYRTSCYRFDFDVGICLYKH